MLLARVLIYSYLLAPVPSSARVEVPCENQINEALAAMGRPPLQNSEYVAVAHDATIYSYHKFINQDKSLREMIAQRDHSVTALYDSKDQLVSSLLHYLNDEMGFSLADRDAMASNKLIEFVKSWGHKNSREEELASFERGFQSGQRFFVSYESYKKKQSTIEEALRKCDQNSNCIPEIKQSLKKSYQEYEIKMQRLQDIQKIADSSKHNRIKKYEKLRDILKAIEELPQERRPAIYSADYKKYVDYQRERSSCLKKVKPSQALTSCPENEALEKIKRTSISFDTDLNVIFDEFLVDGKTCEFTRGRVNIYPKKPDKKYRTYVDMILDENGCKEYSSNSEKKDKCIALREKLKSGPSNSVSGDGKNAKAGIK